MWGPEAAWAKVRTGAAAMATVALLVSPAFAEVQNYTVDMTAAQVVPFGKADLAIDAVPTALEIDKALMRLESTARENGNAIGTASALPVTIERIGQWAKSLESRGLLLVPLTTAMLKSKSS